MNNPSKKKTIPEGGDTFPLSPDLAAQLGDVPPNTPITLAMFRRVLFRLADIRSGCVKKPNMVPLKKALVR